MSAVDDLLEHVDQCPMGWNEAGKVIVARSTTEADVLAWVQKLKALRDGLTPCSHCFATSGGKLECVNCGGAGVNTIDSTEKLRALLFGFKRVCERYCTERKTATGAWDTCTCGTVTHNRKIDETISAFAP